MKQGGGTIDTSALSSGRGLSTGSPSVAPVWSSPTSVKTTAGSTGSYIPSYTSWYPSTHQESMQQSQLIELGWFGVRSVFQRQHCNSCTKVKLYAGPGSVFCDMLRACRSAAFRNTWM
uniref:Uncharacterized protein n=1 Tax=Knipowitschia caucasica TaxID=637954 RepID=A0AAV2K2T2_KNICA